MPRKRKRYVRRGPPCPVDAAFFARAESALGVCLNYNYNARTLIAFSIIWHNNCCQANEAAGTRFNHHGAGRPSDANVHVFVDGLIGILEGDSGIVVRVSKRQRQRDKGHPLRGPVAEFVRVVHDALILPDRNADALARLVANCAPWLGRPSLECWQERLAALQDELAIKPGDEDLIRAIKEARENITEAGEVTSKAAYINTMPERRKRRAKAREPGELYMARMRLAWKNPSE